MRDRGNEDGDGDGRVLSADELDITEQESVATLDDGRFVVGADGPPAAPDTGTAAEDPAPDAGDEQAVNADASPADNPPTTEDAPDAAADEAAAGTTDAAAAGTTNGDADAEDWNGDADAERDATVTGRDVKTWLADELTHHDSTYAYHIASKAHGDVANQQLATDDVGAAFDGLLVWYARQVAADTSVDEALGILLAESSVRVRYPTSRLVEYLDSKDLGPEDSIADLVDAVSADDGLVFPK